MALNYLERQSNINSASAISACRAYFLNSAHSDSVLMPWTRTWSTAKSVNVLSFSQPKTLVTYYFDDHSLIWYFSSEFGTSLVQIRNVAGKKLKYTYCCWCAFKQDLLLLQWSCSVAESVISMWFSWLLLENIYTLLSFSGWRKCWAKSLQIERCFSLKRNFKNTFDLTFQMFIGKHQNIKGGVTLVFCCFIFC